MPTRNLTIIFCAEVFVEEHSDVFGDDAVILDEVSFVKIRCSDGVMLIEDKHQHFFLAFELDPVSDAIDIFYQESDHIVEKTMTVVGHMFTIISDEANLPFSHVRPCKSDIPHKTLSHIIDLPLLSVDAVDSPITSIEEMRCVPLCHNPNSDPFYACRVIQCAHRIGAYLQKYYSDDYLHPFQIGVI